MFPLELPVRVNNFPPYSEFCSDFFHSYFVVGSVESICTVVCFLLGNSPAPELYMPKFAYTIQTPENYPEESIQHSEHGKSLKWRICTVVFRILNCVRSQGFNQACAYPQKERRKRQRYRRNHDFLGSYTANLSNKDTTEYIDFEAVGVGVRARLRKIYHSKQFMLNYWSKKYHEDLMNELWGRNWWGGVNLFWYIQSPATSSPSSGSKPHSLSTMSIWPLVHKCY